MQLRGDADDALGEQPVSDDKQVETTCRIILKLCPIRGRVGLGLGGGLVPNIQKWMKWGRLFLSAKIFGKQKWIL